MQEEPTIQALTFAGANGDPVRGLSLVPPEGEGTPDRGGRAVLVAHAVYGLDEGVRTLARRLAAEGFSVLAPDLYTREGLPGPASTPSDPAPAWTDEQRRAAQAALPDRRALSDLEGAAACLAEQSGVDPRSVAVLGLGMGGTLAFLMGCTSRRVAAVVDFGGRPLYPGLSATKPMQPIELLLNLDRPLLAFFGGADTSVPKEHVDLLRRRLEAGAKDFDLVTYPDAGEGFFHPGRPGFHAPSAEDAWERTLTFLEASL